MLKGIILNGGYSSIRGLGRDKIFAPSNVVVIVDDDKREIYVWVGPQANVKDKFMAARLVNGLRWKLYGGAAPVIQKNEVVEELLGNIPGVDEDISEEVIKEILGI